MIKVIHDAITDTYTEIELTPQEIAERTAKKAEYDAAKAKFNAEQASKDAAKQAVLDKLGLSADEITALLG